MTPPPDPLTAEELTLLLDCVSHAQKYDGDERLENLYVKLWRMSKAARAATSCEEAASQAL